MTKKERLIESLKRDVYCRVSTSSISGVGVVAIRDIPKGTLLFEECNEMPPKDYDDIIDLTEEEISELDHGTFKLVREVFVKSHLGTYSIPETGVNTLHWGYFINHSDDPNLGFKTGVENRYSYVKYITVRDVGEGEELTQNYNLLSLNKVFLREQFKFLNDD